MSVQKIDDAIRNDGRPVPTFIPSFFLQTHFQLTNYELYESTIGMNSIVKILFESTNVREFYFRLKSELMKTLDDKGISIVI